LLIWVSDSLSAVWAINKGRSNDNLCLDVIKCILDKCDEKRNQLIALWLPREENEYADYLSHLAALLNRDEVAGRCKDLEETSASGVADSEDKIRRQTAKKGNTISEILQLPAKEGMASHLSKRRCVHRASRRRKQRIHQVGGQRLVDNQDTLSDEGNSMARTLPSAQTQGDDPFPQVQRSVDEQKEEGSSVARASEDYEAARLTQYPRSAASASDVDRTRWSS